MHINLLFRKRSPLTEVGLSWLSGCQEHDFTAARNTSGRALVSAVLARSLLVCLESSVEKAGLNSTAEIVAMVKSKSAPGSLGKCWIKDNTFHIPHGAPDKVTYHVGVLAMVQALLHHPIATDLLKSYHELLGAYEIYGRGEQIREPLCRTADELYYWLRYADKTAVASNDLSERIEVADNTGAIETRLDLPVEQYLTDVDELATLTGTTAPMVFPSHPEPETHVNEPVVQPEVKKTEGFVGWQAAALKESMESCDTILLAGPTGTGKTFCVQQVALALESTLVVVEGKEGLLDLDFLGAMLPRKDNTRAWVDGPILRAMRLAEVERVVLFLDELTRIPRHQTNLLVGLMNRKSGKVCRAMGLPIEGDGDYYVMEVPMTSEVVYCSVGNLVFIAASNFGSQYATYSNMDPALRRRFSTVLEFDYLPEKAELDLLEAQTGLRDTVSAALVKVARETRRLLDNGELPGCIDTASLLNWGRKCAYRNVRTVCEVMLCGERTWADLVVGRNHVGKLNQGSYDALTDYLDTLRLLPSKGKVDKEDVGSGIF